MKNKNKIVTEQDIADIMNELVDKNPNIKAAIEGQERFMKLISPYLEMNEEELNKTIPEGAYNISNNGFVCITGKAGFINVILEVKKQLKQKP